MSKEKAVGILEFSLIPGCISTGGAILFLTKLGCSKKVATAAYLQWIESYNA